MRAPHEITLECEHFRRLLATVPPEQRVHWRPRICITGEELRALEEYFHRFALIQKCRSLKLANKVTLLGVELFVEDEN